MFGQIAGAVIGGLVSRKNAKDQIAASAAADRMRMMPYLDARNYFQDFYSGATDAFNTGLNTGAYTGPNIVGMSDRTGSGFDAMYNTGNRAVTDAGAMMDATGGFANNAADIYNRAGQDMLGNATQYATNNVEPLLTAAMRDSRRQLEEQQLPGVGLAASGTGNANSSRAGVREAILERGYADRESDMRSNIMDSLVGRSLQSQQNQLGNMMSANQNLGNIYGNAMNMAGTGAAAMVGAGQGQEAYDQAKLDDDRRRFEEQRDFGLNYYGDYGANILGRMPGGSAFGSVTGSTASPRMAALSGALAGAGYGGNLFGGGYGGGFNPGFSGYYNSSGRNMFTANRPTVASAGYY